MGWFSRFFQNNDTQVPLLPSGEPDEKRMAQMAQRRLDAGTEPICQKLVQLQRYTMVATLINGTVQQIIAYDQIQQVLKDEFGLRITSKNEAELEIRNIGTHLCSNGGFARMVLVAHRVAALGGSIRQLEFSWDGICGWKS